MPPDPEFRPRMWFMVILERFGFWIACVLTVAAIAFLYINADRVPRTDRTPRPAVVENQGAPAPDPSRLAEAVGVFAEEPDTTTVGVPISITTDPAGAVVFIDGEYVGASPLTAVALPEGQHLISLLKPDYIQLDTVVVLSAAPASFQLLLREAGDAVLAESNEDLSPESSEDTDEAPSTPATPESAQTTEDPATSLPETDQTDTEEALVADEASSRGTDEPDGVDAPEVEGVTEEPVAQVGQVQVNSEPAGASVLVAGRAVGVTPILLTDLPVGPRSITLRLDGYDDFITTIDVEAQQRHTVKGQLKQPLGRLRILVKPWGNIYIDGELHKKESTVWYTTELSPGNHRVRVVHPVLGNWEQVVVVPAGEEKPITIDLNEDDSGSQ